MTQPELIERLSRLPEGGIITDTNRFNYGYMSSVANTFRLKVLNIVYNGDRTTAKNKRLNPQWLQKYWPVYEKDLQDENCNFVAFRMPEITSLDSSSSGIRYVGSIDGSCGFRIIASRQEMANFNQHKIMNVNNNRAVSVLYDGSNQILECYGATYKMLKSCLVEAIFTNPSDVPTWNVDVDQFPMPDDLIPMLEDLVSKQTIFESKVQLPDEYNQKIA